MRGSRLLLATSLAMLVSFQAPAAAPVQTDKVDLTVVRLGDHLQFQCNPVNLSTAMRSDWKQICNELAVPQVQKLVAAGTIAAVQGPVFDASATTPAAGPMLVRNIALLTAHH